MIEIKRTAEKKRRCNNCNSTIESGRTYYQIRDDGCVLNVCSGCTGIRRAIISKEQHQ